MKRKRNKGKRNIKKELITPESDYIDIVLSNHEQYLKMLNLIRKETKKIIIVQIDGKDETDPVVNTAKKMMTVEKIEVVSEWFSTIAPGRKAVQYTFLKKREFFDYLNSFESFFIVSSTNPYTVIDTDFGFDDIAFLDSNDELLFYTTTHEGFASLSKRYLAYLDE